MAVAETAWAGKVRARIVPYCVRFEKSATCRACQRAASSGGRVGWAGRALPTARLARVKSAASGAAGQRRQRVAADQQPQFGGLAVFGAQFGEGFTVGRAWAAHFARVHPQAGFVAEVSRPLASRCSALACGACAR